MSIVKNTLFFLWEVLKIVVLALVIVVPIRYFIFQPFFVRGASMEPNFHEGDYLIVDEFSYRISDPERGDVIVFKYPKNPTQRYIKRIVGMPGEEIEIKNQEVIIYQNGEQQFLDESYYLPEFIITPGDVKISLSEDEYFVLGDNRLASHDSRSWGTVPEENIIGKVAFRAWPITTFAKIDTPGY